MAKKATIKEAKVKSESVCKKCNAKITEDNVIAKVEKIREFDIFFSPSKNKLKFTKSKDVVNDNLFCKSCGEQLPITEDELLVILKDNYEAEQNAEPEEEVEEEEDEDEEEPEEEEEVVVE
jgi:uncharacterized protein YbaR (Trm112 family)